MILILLFSKLEEYSALTKIHIFNEVELTVVEVNFFKCKTFEYGIHFALHNHYIYMLMK